MKTTVIQQDSIEFSDIDNISDVRDTYSLKHTVKCDLIVNHLDLVKMTVIVDKGREAEFAKLCLDFNK